VCGNGGIQVPIGTKERIVASHIAAPKPRYNVLSSLTGLGVFIAWAPTVETVGYFLSSLMGLFPVRDSQWFLIVRAFSHRMYPSVRINRYASRAFQSWPVVARIPVDCVKLEQKTYQLLKPVVKL
jgi:hypothetical protein